MIRSRMGMWGLSFSALTIVAAGAGSQSKVAEENRVLWQQNRATRNNIFGLLLPQGIVPPISGPVLGTQSSDSVWGSAVGGSSNSEIYAAVVTFTAAR